LELEKTPQANQSLEGFIVPSRNESLWFKFKGDHNSTSVGACPKGGGILTKVEGVALDLIIPQWGRSSSKILN